MADEKAREFWLGPNGVILDIECYERQKENRLHQRGTHVIEYSAYDQLLAEAKKLAEALQKVHEDSSGLIKSKVGEALKSFKDFCREKGIE